MSDMMYVVLFAFWPQKMGEIDRKQADLQNFFLAKPLIYGTFRTHHTYFCLKNLDAPTDGKSTGKNLRIRTFGVNRAKVIHASKFNSSPLKKDGWKTILFLQ